MTDCDTTTIDCIDGYSVIQILLDAEGRLIHIDFGFILGMAPGGNFALETCPFKLPTDYVNVLGGLESQVWHILHKSLEGSSLVLEQVKGRAQSVWRSKYGVLV